nr:traB domain-containing protein isoform X5 [Manis javanica]XP_036862602.1 traB domain-containing protein isoform X5 [Manis javanica]XP_036862603.1 traB domain-containing protein isoform X5 [Manis javanica]
MDAFNLLLEMKLTRRRERPELPRTVTQLVAEDGSRVYVVGTAHFSDDSKRDVVKTIREVQPDVVVVELCQYRVSMLKMDEAALLREAKEISLEKLQQAVRQNGVMSGLMQMLLLKVSAHITEQLGMAPGGEFREAFKEASKVPFCKFHLGDRPIPVTFKRAIAALSFWQKVKLAWGLCFLSDPISKDDVERCKQKDLLEQMMAEMIGEFPDLHRTIVSERDIYLTYVLRQAARRLELPRSSDAEPRKCVPSVVVGVVGMGHVPGIEKNWTTDLNIQEIMTKYGCQPCAGSCCSPLPLCTPCQLHGAASNAGPRGAAGTPRSGWVSWEREGPGRDCSQIQKENPSAPSGVYAIQPGGASTPFQVLCDMRMDGGWTVIQSRDGSRERPLDFERCWQEYKQGFGDLGGDHWLGLEHISSLTSQPGLHTELTVDLQDVGNHTLQAHYDNFHVDKEDRFYRLTLGLYSGNAGDAFRGRSRTDDQEGCGFSTLDRDHDRCAPCTDGARTFASCSHDRSGSGWWYSDCGQADLNGRWPEPMGVIEGLRWAGGGSESALRASVMRVRTTAPRKA